MYLLTKFGDFVSKVSKFILELMPFLATAFVISSLADLNQFLWFIALLLYILKKLGFNINVAGKLKRFKICKVSIGALFDRWFHTISVVGKLEDEYIETTGDMIVDAGKKTLKEAKNMKNWFASSIVLCVFI